MIEKHHRARDELHKAWIRSLPCVMTGNYGCEASHFDKWTDKAMATKASDCYVLPLTHAEHMDLHSKGTITYWGGEENARKALNLSEYLYHISGDTDKAVTAILAFRRSLYA